MASNFGCDIGCLEAETQTEYEKFGFMPLVDECDICWEILNLIIITTTFSS